MSGRDFYSPYQQETSGKAVAALVLGICGFVAIPIICSIYVFAFVFFIAFAAWAINNGSDWAVWIDLG